MNKFFLLCAFSYLASSTVYGRGDRDTQGPELKSQNNPLHETQEKSENISNGSEITSAQKLERLKKEHESILRKLTKTTEKRVKAEKKLIKVREDEAKLQKLRVDCEREQCNSEYHHILSSKENDPRYVLAQDWIRAWKLQRLVKDIKNRAIFLAIGNTGLPNKEIANRYLVELKELLYGIKERNLVVFYDGDSTLAPFIEKFVDAEKSAAISAGIKPYSNSHRTWVIENSVFRTEILSEFRQIVFSPDSLTGFGLFIGKNRESDFFVFDPLRKWRNGFAEWGTSLVKLEKVKRELPEKPLEKPKKTGIKENKGNKFTRFVKGLAESSEPTEHTNFNSGYYNRPTFIRHHLNLGIPDFLFHDPHTSSDAILLLCLLDRAYFQPGKLKTEDEIQFSPSDMERLQLVRWVNHIRKNLEIIESDKAPAGAVFFGSAQDSPYFSSLVEEVIRPIAVNGTPITTGGGPGLMARANRVAFNEKVYSLGILHSQEERSTDQTLTRQLGSEDYAERIPLLLLNRQIVLIGPGGRGTMREIATTFVKLGPGDPNWKPYIVFIGRDYYDPLFSVVSHLDLSEEIKNRIHIVDSNEEMEELYKAILNDQTINQKELRSASAL